MKDLFQKRKLPSFMSGSMIVSSTLPGHTRSYYVYLMTNRSGSTLYTGMTNDLARRVYEHKHGLIAGFTSRYNTTRLVYFESFCYVVDAIAREKEIKGWVRRKKNALIEETNPDWKDLAMHVLVEGE